MPSNICEVSLKPLKFSQRPLITQIQDKITQIKARRENPRPVRKSLISNGVNVILNKFCPRKGNRCKRDIRCSF